MLVPVVLSGGAGTRLWPVSREGHPKPFMRLADGQSLLQKTFLRGVRQEGVGEVLTITNRDYYFRSKDEYAALRLRDASLRHTFLLEPVGRNTAPAILLGAFKVRDSHGEAATLLVLPADHLIADTGYPMRGTIAGDAWDRAEAASCAVPSPSAAGAKAGVSLGLPSLGKPGSTPHTH